MIRLSDASTIADDLLCTDDWHWNLQRLYRRIVLLFSTEPDGRLQQTCLYLGAAALGTGYRSPAEFNLMLLQPTTQS